MEGSGRASFKVVFHHLSKEEEASVRIANLLDSQNEYHSNASHSCYHEVHLFSFILHWGK
jgi:hypothetical protein